MDEDRDLEDKDDEDKDEDHGDGEDEDHEDDKHEDDDADAGGEVVGITVELGRHFAGKILVSKYLKLDSKFGLSSADTFKEIKFVSKNIATAIVIIVKMVNQWLTN